MSGGLSLPAVPKRLDKNRRQTMEKLSAHGLEHKAFEAREQPDDWVNRVCRSIITACRYVEKTRETVA
jgi:hypothetical protein